MHTHYRIWAMLALTCMVVAACVPRYADTPAIELVLCPQTDCKTAFLEEIADADTVQCALYSLNLPEVLEAVSDPKVSLVLHKEWHHNLWHHKFCVFDHKRVWTGSWNPTTQNQQLANSALIIRSQAVAKAYEKEWKDLAAYKEPHAPFKTKDMVVAFCPKCEEELLHALETAQYRILFASYVLSNPAVADVLQEKQAQGVQVKGVMDQSMDRYFPESLRGDFVFVKGIHHKFFVVDDHLVMLGSANPTRSGLRKNRENIVIFEDQAIAAQLAEEVNRLAGLADLAADTRPE